MDRQPADLRRFYGVLAAAGLVFGIALIGLVKERLAASPRYRVGPVDLEFAALPASIEGLRDRILPRGPLLSGPRSLFDPRLAADLRQALEAHPWISEVTRITRRFPSEIEVQATVRLPVGVVCLGRMRAAVDAEGRVLEMPSDLGPPELPEIWILAEERGARPRPGSLFAWESVQEAAALAACLLARRGREAEMLASLGVHTITVGREGERRRAGAADLRLHLECGVVVDWGRSPRSPLKVFESSVAERLAHLDRVLRAYPGLLGLERVDLRGEEPLAFPRT